MLIKILYGIDYGLQKIKILHKFSTHNKQGLYSLEFFADGYVMQVQDSDQEYGLLFYDDLTIPNSEQVYQNIMHFTPKVKK